MRVHGLLLLATLAACSETPATNAATKGKSTSDAQAILPSVTRTNAGTYRVEVDPSLDLKTLPANADLKMLDGNLAQYALKLCELDFSNKLAPDRCEIFVQPDKSGYITGYATLLQGEDVRIETALETDHKRGGAGCFLSGTLESSDYEQPEAKLDISTDFTARLPFFGWEKSPGNWIISSESEPDDQYSAGITAIVTAESTSTRYSRTQLA